MHPFQAKFAKALRGQNAAQLVFRHPVFDRLIRRRDRLPPFPHLPTRGGQEEETARFEKLGEFLHKGVFLSMRHMFDDLGAQHNIVRGEIGPLQNLLRCSCLESQVREQATGMLDHSRDRLDAFAGSVHGGQIRQPAAAAADFDHA